MSAGATNPVGSPANAEVKERLHRAAYEFQAVFLNKMFQAMHESAIHSTLGDPSPGEETFRTLLDDKLASQASSRMTRGIGEDLYRALCRRLPAEATSAEKGRD